MLKRLREIIWLQRCRFLSLQSFEPEDLEYDLANSLQYDHYDCHEIKAKELGRVVCVNEPRVRHKRGHLRQVHPAGDSPLRRRAHVSLGHHAESDQNRVHQKHDQREEVLLINLSVLFRAA